MEIAVSPISIADVLKNLEKGSWLVPHFQRDFVWSVASIRDLLASIIRGRPVGMVTLWAQADDTDLPLEPISVPDSPNDEGGAHRYLVPPGTRTNKYFAILDGKQRCTAIAMAFAGLKPDNRRSRYCGRYYLDVNAEDGDGGITFYKETDIARLRIESDRAAIAQGFFPFQSSVAEESITWQWIRYVQELKNPGNYAPGACPSAQELARRERIVKSAFDGINNTRFAVLVVPDHYRLDEICDIFDKLNTTGTKVSTVDLIHSWLYADTAGKSGGPIQLRKWMREMKEEDGAVGWIDAERRPELVAQFVTAAYVALDAKAPARPQGGAVRSVISIKSGDLLATPTLHWLNIINGQSEFAAFLGEMQKAVIGSPFPWVDAPYPAASTIYFAIRWKYEAELRDTAPWSIDDLNAVFRVFYWKNALTSRYDQGFLTKVERDIRFMLEVLGRRQDEGEIEWRRLIDERVDVHFRVVAPSRAEIESLLKRGRIAGAMQKALLLPMLAGVRNDLISPDQVIGFPDGEPSEIHHFFPIAWCANNERLALTRMDPDGAEVNLPQSIVNLIPLSRGSNNIWKTKHPAQVFAERALSYEQVSDVLAAAFIDQEAFEMAVGSEPDPMAFWQRRSRLYAEELMRLMRGV